ncbi:hypothetical protein H1P_350006 [Hyella patelloides LEGE 07179]|uniref:Uncharacterized protein n=1 Tax=Hyella patelloides LEGE 07179 TaxID=945734 RepID=A0A563VVY2_9CYAN|nr:hypothetical protein H1P_350006 [Hyella patelloides LEGE 07179]
MTVIVGKLNPPRVPYSTMHKVEELNKAYNWLNKRGGFLRLASVIRN